MNSSKGYYIGGINQMEEYKHYDFTRNVLYRENKLQMKQSSDCRLILVITRRTEGRWINKSMIKGSIHNKDLGFYE